MTIATHPAGTQANDQPIQQKPISFDEFLIRYGGNDRYELSNGEVFNLEPTGLHVREAPLKEVEVAAFITAKICVQIDGIGSPSQMALLNPGMNFGVGARHPH